MKLRWMFALVLSAAMQAQSVQSGSSVLAGAFVSQYADGEGGPLTYSARTDMAVFGSGVTGELLPSACGGNAACLANAYNASAATGHQGAALSYTGSQTVAPPAAGSVVSGLNINGLNSYVNGINTQITDPDFGTVMIRATDASLNSSDSIHCLGGGTFGTAFDMGSTGNVRLWAPDESKLMIWPNSKPLTMLAISNDTVAPTNICGGYLPGASTFAGNSPHDIFTVVTDQENTVVYTGLTGSLLTGETLTNGTKTAALLAINPDSNFAQLGVVGNSGSYSGNVWNGAHGSFTAVANPPTGAANTPYSNTIQKGVLCDGTASDPDQASVCLYNPNTSTTPTCAANDTNPLCWYVQWEMLFEFNFLPSPPDATHFVQAQNDCLPQNYGASWSGVFVGDDADQSFTVAFSDNGQSNHTGQTGAGYTCPGVLGAGQAGNTGTHSCTGPVYVANFRKGSGCRVFNSWTNLISGDYGTTGTTYSGQANDVAILGATGTQTPGDIYIQDTTGAETQLTCMRDVNNQCMPSGWTHAFTGIIYPKASVPADSSHVWRDCGTAGTACGTTGATHYFTPSAAPTPAVYYYPDVLHDADQPPNGLLSHFSHVQQPDMAVTAVCNNGGSQTCVNTTGANQTVITYSNNATYSPGQVFLFQGLGGTQDSYLNCNLPANQCPTWTAAAGGLGSGSGGYIVISDTTGTGYSISDTGVMTPSGEDFGVGGFRGENDWQNQTTTVNPSLLYGGHGAVGNVYKFLGGNYQAISQFNPSTPSIDNTNGLGYPSNPSYSPDTNVADAQTPPPATNYIKLLPQNIATDQHGSYFAHGSSDYTPPIFITTKVCAQGPPGVGNYLCPATFTSVWHSEIIGVENWTTRSSPGNLVGADCNYGSGPNPCVYRLGHTFSSNSNWAFGAQNAIGNESPMGRYFAFPSDWNSTLGCTDLTTTCISPWQATAPTGSGTGVSWTSDSANPPNVTITMTNSFCPTGGSQYYWVSGAVQTISCGTRAGTVKLTGFAESWLNNQTLTLGPNTANNWQCDSTDSNAGTCNKFVLAGVTGAPGNSSATESSVQKATPTTCGSGVPCQRTDIWIAKISTAHQ